MCLKKLLLPFIILLHFSAVGHADIRVLDPITVAEVKELTQQGPVVLVMRHGEQQQSNWVEELPSPAYRKIAMMRKEENLTNPLTKYSSEELMETVRALQDIIQSSELSSWHIESSENLRALQAAATLAEHLGIPLIIRKRWKCVNYPDECDMSTEELLNILPSGSLPWDKELVDLVIGEGTFDLIHKYVGKSLHSYEPNEGAIVITHTQQINAACEQKGLPVQRLGYYGFVLINAQEAQLFSSGFYKD